MIESSIEEGLSKGMSLAEISENLVSLFEQGKLKLIAEVPSEKMLASARVWASQFPSTMDMWEAGWRSMWNSA